MTKALLTILTIVNGQPVADWKIIESYDFASPAMSLCYFEGEDYIFDHLEDQIQIVCEPIPERKSF